MGWFYGSRSRPELIDEICTATEHRKVLRRFFSGNTMWTVEEVTIPEESGPVTKRFIGCYLIQRDGPHNWGYKPLEESMGPCVVTCPLAFLDMVPDPGMYATEWRARVRKYHAQRNAYLSYRRAVKAWKLARNAYQLANIAHREAEFSGRATGKTHEKLEAARAVLNARHQAMEALAHVQA